MTQDNRTRLWDGVLWLLLLLFSMIYLRYWPREIYGYDDGVFLYEAKRVFDGEVIYRDFFEIVAPGPFYLMAGFYALFGVTLDTARGVMALTHGLIGALVFALCRRLGVRISIALAAALLHLTIAFPASSIVSVHWLGTCLTLLLMAALVRGPGTSAIRTALWGGLAGVWILMQHQKALLPVIAVGAIIVVDNAVYARHALRTGARALAAYGAAVIALLLPTAVWLVTTAGADEVARALVWHPLYNYTRTSHSKGTFGSYVPAMHPLGFIIKWLPSVLPAAALTMIFGWRQAHTTRPWVVTTVIGAATFISTLYNPNFVHLAFLAAVWAPLAAGLIETLLAAAERVATPLRYVAPLVGILLALGCCWRLADNLHARRSAYAFPIETSFGWMDVTSENDAQLLEWLTQSFRDAHAPEVFCYPNFPALYLLTGTRNPTRFQITIPDYTDRDQLEEIVATLEARQVPFVVRTFYPGVASLEPLHSYLGRHYERVTLPFGWAGVLLRRRSPTELPPIEPQLF